MHRVQRYLGSDEDADPVAMAELLELRPRGRFIRSDARQQPGDRDGASLAEFIFRFGPPAVSFHGIDIVIAERHFVFLAPEQVPDRCIQIDVPTAANPATSKENGQEDGTLPSGTCYFQRKAHLELQSGAAKPIFASHRT